MVREYVVPWRKVAPDMRENVVRGIARKAISGVHPSLELRTIDYFRALPIKTLRGFTRHLGAGKLIEVRESNRPENKISHLVIFVPSKKGTSDMSYGQPTLGGKPVFHANTSLGLALAGDIRQELMKQHPTILRPRIKDWRLK